MKISMKDGKNVERAQTFPRYNLRLCASRRKHRVFMCLLIG